MENGRKKRKGVKEMNRERRKRGGGEGAYIESAVNLQWYYKCPLLIVDSVATLT